MTSPALETYVLTLKLRNRPEVMSYAFAAPKSPQIQSNPDRCTTIVIEALDLAGEDVRLDFIDTIQSRTISLLGNGMSLQGLPLVDFDLYEDLQDLSRDAMRRCGCAHETFVSFFSASVDALIGRKGNAQNIPFILKMAPNHGYLTPEEVDAMQQDLLDSGACIHGIDPDCCPAGCGEY